MERHRLRRTRKVVGSRILKLLIFVALCAMVAIFLVFSILGRSELDAGLGEWLESALARQKALPSVAQMNFTRVSFVMDDDFALVWRTVSKRITLPIELVLERLTSDSSTAEPRVYSSQKSHVLSTFYGHSSLKLQRTSKRSLYIHSEVPFTFPTPVSPPFATNTPVKLHDFILLSLWEDTHRLSYRTSIDLLQQLDLFFSYAVLVELRCYPAAPNPTAVHPCAPTEADTAVTNGTQRGRTLGVYLLLEPPAMAVHRRMQRAFAALEEFDEAAAHVRETPSAIHPRLFETATEYAARVSLWRRMGKEVREKYDGNEKAGLEVAETSAVPRPPPNNHVLNFVPTYTKNSSYAWAYKRMQGEVEKLGFYDTGTGDGKDTTSTETRFFDLPQYMAWIAINTILENGDYDDEAIFFGMMPSAKDGETPKERKKSMPLYLGLMAWDYDTIFAKCHRKPFFYSPYMYCAEASVDKLILKEKTLFKRYLQILHRLLRFVGPEHFAKSVALAQGELQTILRYTKGASVATFGAQYDPNTGDAWIRESFLKQRVKILRSLTAIYGDDVLNLPEDSVLGTGMENVTLFGHTNNPPRREETTTTTTAAAAETETTIVQKETNDHTEGEGDTKLPHLRLLGGRGSMMAKEVRALRQRLASKVRLIGSRLDSGKWTTIGVRGPAPEMPLLCPGPLCERITTVGLYCARVSVPSNVTKLSPALRENLAHNGVSPILVDIPIALEDSTRGSAEAGMRHFTKPSPMEFLQHTTSSAMTTQSTIEQDDQKAAGEAVLQLVVPHVWPGAERSGVVVARALWRNDTSYIWNRRNLPLQVYDRNGEGEAKGAQTMLIRGFSAVRLAPHPEQVDEMDAQHTQRGPLLFTSMASTVQLQTKWPQRHEGGQHGDSKTSGTTMRIVTAHRSVRMLDISPPPQSLVHTTKSGIFDPDSVLYKDADIFTTRTGNQGDSPPTSPPRLRCPLFVHGLVTIPAEKSLAIPSGCAVVLQPGAVVRVHGHLHLNGTASSPIVLTSHGPDRTAAWRTIHVDGASAVLSGRYAFITGAGVRGAILSGTGHHHKHSAAVSATKNAMVSLQHVFFVELRGPAIAAGRGARIHLADTLVQWAEMGVECIMCEFHSNRTVWTNFPSWDTAFADDDNDALYLSGGHHRVVDSVIAHTKDDGIDSGVPKRAGGGGSLLVMNTIIESCMHEGIALSAEPNERRVVLIASTIIQYCQQGVELGYTSTKHSAAMTGSLVQHCDVGLRAGDNYKWHYDGELIIHHTTLAHNGINVMNYDRKHAAPLDAMQFHAAAQLPHTHLSLLTEHRVGGDDTVTNVTLWPDERLRKGSEGADWCEEFFSLPMEKGAVVRQLQHDASHAEKMETRYVHDVGVNL